MQLCTSELLYLCEYTKNEAGKQIIGLNDELALLDGDG